MPQAPQCRVAATPASLNGPPVRNCDRGGEHLDSLVSQLQRWSSPREGRNDTAGKRLHRARRQNRSISAALALLKLSVVPLSASHGTSSSWNAWNRRSSPRTPTCLPAKIISPAPMFQPRWLLPLA